MVVGGGLRRRELAAREREDEGDDLLEVPHEAVDRVRQGLHLGRADGLAHKVDAAGLAELGEGALDGGQARRHGGFVKVDSVKGEGAVFSLYFPQPGEEKPGELKCWEYMKCGRDKDATSKCPAHPHFGKVCWAVAGTFCEGKVQGTFAQNTRTAGNAISTRWQKSLGKRSDLPKCKLHPSDFSSSFKLHFSTFSLLLKHSTPKIPHEHS